MPALSLPAPDAARYLRLIALGLAALILASLATAWGSPAEAREWTPQIKVARNSQVYWENVMRAADASVRAVRKTKRQTKAGLKRARSRLGVAVERRRAAKRTLTATRAQLRVARDELRTARAAIAALPDWPPAAPDVVAATVALLFAGVVDTDGRGPSDTVPVAVATSEMDTPADVPVWERKHQRLEKRAQKHKRHYRRTVRKAQRAARSVRATRSRLASLKVRERTVIARRESAERNLGSWILTMERYARGRAANMAKYRPGVDSPFAWPARGRISQHFSRSHDGLDIAGYQGTRIRASAFGVVSYIGWNPWDEHGRAFMIVIAHVGGLETLYGHILPRRNVRIGQPVKQGEVIGYMGSTGNSTGTHLHFEVRRGRTTVNPLGYL